MLLLDGIDACGIFEAAKSVVTDILESKNVHIVTTSVKPCKCVTFFQIHSYGISLRIPDSFHFIVLTGFVS
jgi:hypothetical protein